MRQVHHDLGQARGVQEDVTKHEIFRRALQATDDVAVPGGAGPVTRVLRQAPLAAAVQRGDGEPQRSIGQLGHPIAGIVRITVEHQDRGVGALLAPRPHELSVNARTLDAGEIQVRAVGVRRLEFGGDQLDLGPDGGELGQRPVPVGIEIGRAGIHALVIPELVQRQVKCERH